MQRKEVEGDDLQEPVAAYKAETDALKRRELARRVQEAADRLQDVLRQRGIIR